MGKKSPAVTLLWMYKGKNAEARREQIRAWNYPDFELVEADPELGWCRAIQDVGGETEVCVFWMDDDKPVGPDFLHQMARPLMSREDFAAVMHFWSGNAVSVLKEILDASPINGVQPEDTSLLKLIVPMLDATDKGPNGRVHLALSSTERLAPLSMEPVGFPS
jgi:hypothetical protein